MEIMEQVGDRVRRVREGRAMSQQMLAESSGVEVASISRIENNKARPRFITINKLARALNVDAGWLLNGESLDLGKVVAAA